MAYVFLSYVVFAAVILVASYAAWKVADLQHQLREVRKRLSDLERAAEQRKLPTG